MSINQFSSSTSDLPETLLWWIEPITPKSNLPPSSLSSPQLYHHHYHNQRRPSAAAMSSQNTPFRFNLNNQQDERDSHDHEDEEEEEAEEHNNMELLGEEISMQKEPMFEKPLTPSDVGKLNRLVIPKQHAERYFPLGGGDSVEKGLLLSFEDESGKCWRFRYSYWNSSQSYVLTKGWSRFVKEKRLDAGDVVMFDRYKEESDRFFIGWRRRSAVMPAVAQPVGVVVPAGGWTRVFYSTGSYPSRSHPNGPPFPYLPDCLHAPGARVLNTGGGETSSTCMQNQTTSSSAAGNSKTLRLFGVNLECQLDEPIPDDGSSGHNQPHSITNAPNHHHLSNYQNHMDINFSRDVKQTKYHHQG